MNSFDYIIAGTGCAGLSLAIHLIESGAADDKRILLIDRAQKNRNDHTWCFWETGSGLFEMIVHKKWNKLSVYSDNFEKTSAITPYTYKMIRAKDFYKFCLEKIAAHKNFSWRYGEVKAIESDNGVAQLTVNNEIVTARYIFSSIPLQKPVFEKGHYFLWQHFKGRLIETEKPVFDEKIATIMDFRVPQGNDTAFVYVLPVSKHTALIEYTVFSANLLEDCLYDHEIDNYTRNVLGIEHYSVLEVEKGKIPMTNFPFQKRDGNIIFVGTAGGLTKPSTGYTFRFIQKDSKAIAEALKNDNLTALNKRTERSRFLFYDSILLHILQHRRLAGKEIFVRLFKKNRMSDVLQFLENGTTMKKELKIISTLQKASFSLAAIRHFL